MARTVFVKVDKFFIAKRSGKRVKKQNGGLDKAGPLGEKMFIFRISCRGAPTDVKGIKKFTYPLHACGTIGMYIIIAIF